MKNTVLKNILFWKKLSRYLLVGFSVFTILFAAQTSALFQNQVVNAQTADCTSGACPLPSNVSYPNGTVSCDSNNVGNFYWSPINYPGKTVDHYEVRINAAPAGWGPDTSTPAMQPAVVQDPNAGPDRAVNTPAGQTSAMVQLTAGQYLDWVAVPYFTDGTKLDKENPNNWGHWGGWTCGGSVQPTATPTPAPTSTPAPTQTPAPANAQAHIAGGDFMQAFNNTTQEGTWRDPVSAAPGNIIEYRIQVINDGNAPTGDVQVWGSVNGLVPQDPGLQQVITSKIHDPNDGQSVTDTAVVTVTGGVPVGMRYYEGHARIHGVTNRYNCANICPLTDDVLGGINIGIIQPGQMVEVAFKAELTPAPTVSPTPTPQPGATATPVPAQGGTNVNANVNNNSNVAAAAASSNSSSSSSSSSNNTINITNVNNGGGNVGVGTTGSTIVASAGTQVLGVSTLPKTGLPEIAWASLAFVPAGFRLRRFSKMKKALEDHPSFISEMRQYKRA